MKKHDVCYADPPWPYNSRSHWKKTRFGGGLHGHYDVMSVEDICALAPQIDAIMAKDAVMLMWTTGPHLGSALKVLEAWGFTYKTIAFTWIKMVEGKWTNMVKGKRVFKVYTRAPYPWKGTGYYTKSNAEIVLLATRGKTVKPARKDVSQVVCEPHPREFRVNSQGKRYSAIIHSRKPVEVRERVEALFGPQRSYVELFAREAAPGWTAIGNQLPEGAVTLTPTPAQAGAPAVPGQLTIYDVLGDAV